MNEIFSWADTSTWASLAEAFSDRRLSRKRVREALQSRYVGLEVLHACRSASLCSYYENGLLLSDSELLDKEAVVRFFGSNATLVELAAVDAAVKKLGERDHGRLFVSIDGRSLIERSGHYLIYGSERLLAIAAHLGDSPTRYRWRLKSHGKPTLFRALLRWHALSETDIDGISREIAAEWQYFMRYGFSRIKMYSFILREPIPASDILGHLHPTLICDPMERNTIYRWQDTES
jgi:hypothetical protein